MPIQPASALYRLAALLLAATLAACASVAPVPRTAVTFSLPRMLKAMQERPGQTASAGMLVVQAEDSAADATRWSLFDPLGAPVARQILHAGHWRNDGFLPPNREARALFAALVFAWTPEAELPARYGTAHLVLVDGVRTLSVRGQPVVTASTAVQTLRLELADGTRWTITPLEGP